MSGTQVELSGTAVLVLCGGLAWLVGSAALDQGVGTVILAAGLALTVWLFTVVRREPLAPYPLPGPRRRRVLGLLVGAVLLTGVGGTLLSSQGFGEFTIPATAIVFGAVLVPISSTVDRRALGLVALALIGIGVAGAMLAARSIGPTYPEGLVGFGVGVVLWLTGAAYGGVLTGLRDRVGSR